MKLTHHDPKTVPAADLLVLFGFQGEAVAWPKGIEVPALAKSSFEGEFRESRLTDAVSGSAKRVLQVGLGKRSEGTSERVRRAAAIAVKKAEKVRAASCVLWFETSAQEPCGGTEAVAQALAEGAVMATYQPGSLKSEKKPPFVKNVKVAGTGAAFKRALEKGRAVGEANVFTRWLQDMPGNRMRPRDLVKEARGLAARSPQITASALDEKAMRTLKMGSLLSVSQGSEEPAYLIHLVYKPKGRRSKGKVAVVGKGLTFDAGGISLKPAAKMDEMKYDMSGGAAVLGLFHALARVQPDVEVHGLVPTSENLPDGRATKPGDIFTAMNGTTIEVLNTDAEGRLILCDALAYTVKKVQPDAIVDLATLTGAVIIALGHELSGCMGNDEALVDSLVAAGKRTGELVWPLPLMDVHRNQLKGTVGDLRNINSGQGAGSTIGGAFLSHFVGDTPWAHLDIAGTAWGVEERDYQGGSTGTGVGVRLLVDFLEHR